MQDAGYKRCTKCGETRALEDFPKGRPECRDCRAAYHKAYRAANLQRKKAQRKAEYARDREKVLNERRKPCARCGSDKGEGERKRYCDACQPIIAELKRQKVNERKRAWNAANPERRAASNRYHWQRWYTLKRDAFVEDVVPLVVLERHDGTCGICGEDVDPLDFHVDHIWPLARGGEHSYQNTQPAHPDCNQRKGVKTPEGRSVA
jgi:5-methylcytosine-specific restriction endonuclease McrA